MSARRAVALVAALAAVAASVTWPGSTPKRADDPRPNIVLILTDDQSFDTLPSVPAAMPWLQSHVFDPADHWTWFPNAVISTPLCCPSRSTILTGRYSEHTGVRNNALGHVLDESDTLPVWLHDAGYFTAFVGKYLNRYPFHRFPYVPAGWDRFLGKGNAVPANTYYGYPFMQQGVAYRASTAAPGYATDFLASKALDDLAAAPTDRPFFLEFAPSAPHAPITPPPRYRGRFAGVPIATPISFDEADVSDKPAWIRELPPLTIDQQAKLALERERESETLLAVDDAVRTIMNELAARGDLRNTVIFFLTDNGYSFGAHRWIGKQCPYEECIRTPFAVRVPWAPSTTVSDVVSNVDLAPTIASFAGATPALPEDGRDITPLLDPRSIVDLATREGALLEYLGGGRVPDWYGVRTPDFTYVEDAVGTVELYDLTGVLGPADPGELDNRADDPAYAHERTVLAALLQRLRSE